MARSSVKSRGIQLRSRAGRERGISARVLPAATWCETACEEILQKGLLAGEDFRAARIAVAGQDVERKEGESPSKDAGPVFEVRVPELVARAVDGGVAGAQDAFFGEPDEAIAAGVRPAKGSRSGLRECCLSG